jgi:hypothetical protein
MMSGPTAGPNLDAISHSPDQSGRGLASAQVPRAINELRSGGFHDPRLPEIAVMIRSTTDVWHTLQPGTVLLPILALVLLIPILGRTGRTWRQSVLAAAVVWGVWLTAGTEVLSALRLLSTGSVTAWWTVTVIILGVAVTTQRCVPIAVGNDASVRTRIPERRLAGGLVFILLTTLTVALVAPPNTFDSMTYHMSRVMHWIENRSVVHYPTHIGRQLYLAPGAEFAILHLQLLTGGDRFANLVQWLGMAGSLVGVSLIARELGGGPFAQLFVAVTAATLPMGILQASSTQNDYVVSFWLAMRRIQACTAFSIRSRSAPASASCLRIRHGPSLSSTVARPRCHAPRI